MKFAHIADCHLGSYREERLQRVNTSSFVKAIDHCLNENVDFVCIAGDLFNTALPSIDVVKETVRQLRRLKERGIACYIIAGSHDFSPSGKAMLHVLEEAQLCIDVVKGDIVDGQLKLRFTVDQKTGAKITGMIGRRGMLERTYYENIHREHLEHEEGFKIFMFHTALTELKPKELLHMDSSPVSLLPRNFNYYAGGHVHIVSDSTIDGYEHIVYPGPTFPNSFTELEKLGGGGMYIYDHGNVRFIPIVLKQVFSYVKDCEGKSAEEVEQEIKTELLATDVDGKIVCLRLRGLLGQGRVSDIAFKEISKLLYEHGAYFVMRNTSSVQTQSFEAVHVKEDSVENIEQSIVQEHLGMHKGISINVDAEKKLMIDLMQALSEESHEGEKKYEFEGRVAEMTKKVFETHLGN